MPSWGSCKTSCDKKKLTSGWASFYLSSCRKGVRVAEITVVVSILPERHHSHQNSATAPPLLPKPVELWVYQKTDICCRNLSSRTGFGNRLSG